MKKRLLTAAVGIPLLLVLILAAPLWVFGIAVGLVCSVACFELLHMALREFPRRIKYASMICAFILPVISSFESHLAWSVGVLLLLFFVLSIEQMISYLGSRRITLEMVAIAIQQVIAQHAEEQMAREVRMERLNGETISLNLG